MESMVVHYNNIYKGKKIFLTGHTGFKGSWMTQWLTLLGAEVVGYSLAPNTTPNHFDLLKLKCKSYINNICDLNSLTKAINETSPDIVFHLAAQPLVRYSYLNPIETYNTNVMGTVNVLEACRNSENIKAIVLITTDKCYENVEKKEGYIETDAMGGYDPYSSSKGCAELAISSYRNSFYNIDEYKSTHNTLIASARAGNVIGGGDWCVDRLIPDIIKSTIKKETTLIRYPHATRPWQHVLEPINGYLVLGQKLLEEKTEFAEGWNFGPNENEILSVKEVLEISEKYWNDIKFKIDLENKYFHEANLLSLNISKAQSKLGWNPIWTNQKSIENTINWYREFYQNNILSTDSQIIEFSKYI
jgi:CDP-glucose 4,6-dehydratase